jgi:hypothetical protein
MSRHGGVFYCHIYGLLELFGGWECAEDVMWPLVALSCFVKKFVCSFWEILHLP